MKPPQERSTPISITDHIRVLATDEFSIQAKYTHGNYTTWLSTNNVDGVKVFRDIVKYILASLTNKSPPEKYKNHKPVSERSRAFSERHEGFDEYGAKIRIQIKQVSGPTKLHRKSSYSHNGPETIQFNELSELKKLKRSCESWLSYEQN